MDSKKLSKTLAHALRHEPWLYELELDEEGWVGLGEMIRALASDDARLGELCRVQIQALVTQSDKQLYEIAGSRIRALYGHSTPQKLQRISAAPPDVLFHGTSPSAAESILERGLCPMGRQYVHLSIDRGTAEQVGRRKSPKPALLHVAASAAHAEGVLFYAGNDKVWLADVVPPEFIRSPNR